VVVRLVVPVLALLLAAAPIASASAQKPLVLKVKWRLVVGSDLLDAAYVMANDRYVTFQRGSSYPGRLTLIDELTGRRKQLSGPGCPTPVPDTFGGPWLLVVCPGTALVPGTYELYNLSNGSWVPFQVSPQCKFTCEPVAVGRYWWKLLTDEGIYPYGPSDYYLQNISTGQFERDPATPGGTVFDDLNAPSGSVPLCPPLRYPSVYPRGGPYLGSISFYGQFALTADEPPGATSLYQLRRCGSRLNQSLSDSSDPYLAAPVASSRAVITTHDGITLHGWFLPNLRRFTIRTALRDYVTPAAITDRTIYIFTHGQLWAATLPPQHRSRQ
jgi:hypothetical protein